ncbi:MAG: metal-dependent transcriptional regulator [Candidatus Methylacidiphilales bacterium]
MASPTIENYAKRIWMLHEQDPESPVALGALAAALGVTAGTVTTMIKMMAAADLVRYHARRGVELTARGRRLALHVLRRHRVIELYLVERLGMDWAEVHEEAEILEHAISDRVLKKMEEVLGDTSHDPHGAPIPGDSGEWADPRKLTALNACPPGSTVTIAQVRQQERDVLDFLSRHGLRPGALIEVVRVDPKAGIVEVRRGRNEAVHLGLHAAAAVEVE